MQDPNALIDDLSRLGRTVAAQLTAQVADACRTSIRRRQRLPSLRSMIVKRLSPLVTANAAEAMMTGFVQAEREVESTDSSVSLALDKDTDRVLRALASMTGRQVTYLQKKIGTDTLRIVDGVARKVDDELRRAVYDLVRRQVKPSTAAAELRKRLEALGITPGSPHSLETVYRTNASQAYWAGKWIAYNRPENVDKFWGFRYYTMRDDRVRDSHQELDGVTLPKHYAFWQTYWPPNGYNCRCWVVMLHRKVKVVRPPQDIEPPPEGFRASLGSALAAHRVYDNV